jgi:hypothetical protein
MRHRDLARVPHEEVERAAEHDQEQDLDPDVGVVVHEPP